MSDTDTLESLEADYFDQPAHAQVADLIDINRLRARLGLLQVDSRLRPIAPAVAGRTSVQVAAAISGMVEAAELYADFLAMEQALVPHREYADAVARATSGGGMTPVKPLATMGTGGGPLLCDHCHRPMILEGGAFHGVFADKAWRQKSHPDDWRSYIKGGMVVDKETNGTLRVYHGYAGRPQDCVFLADQAREEKRRALVDQAAGRRMRDPLTTYINHTLPLLTDIERGSLIGRVLDSMYGFDPGIGVNRPGDDR